MNAMSLWYRKPASDWNEALPIGNGRLGGMVFGDTFRERVQLNEDSVWYGGHMDWNNPDALAYLPDIRRMIAECRLSEAEKLAAAALSGTPQQMRHYTTLGELYLEFGHWEVMDYRRSLDLERGVASVAYEAEGAATGGIISPAIPPGLWQSAWKRPSPERSRSRRNCPECITFMWMNCRLQTAMRFS